MTVEEGKDPWERFGWLMGAIWLIFLGFPIGAAVVADTATVWRVLTVAAILTFAAVYVHGFVLIGKVQSWSQVTRVGLVHLTILMLLVLAAAVVVGLDALGMAPFIVAFAMFCLPLPWALGLGAGVLTLGVLLPVLAGQFGEYWFFVPVVVLVGAATGMVRILEQRQLEHREQEAELALVAERERVARDVHDVLGHSLTVVTVKAELAERLVDADPERAKVELASIQSLTRQALAEIRATVSGLRVARLVDELDACATALHTAGMAASLPDDPQVVDPRHRIVLAWALREAVTNVIRHSRAGQVRVELGADWLQVSDDGTGFSGQQEGNGIRGMRERVTAAGGQVSIEPGPDRVGTTVMVQL